MEVNSDFAGDWMKGFDGLVGPMLEDGLSVLIYGKKEGVGWGVGEQGEGVDRLYTVL